MSVLEGLRKGRDNLIASLPEEAKAQVWAWLVTFKEEAPASVIQAEFKRVR